jgi:hypothetical protein
MVFTALPAIGIDWLDVWNHMVFTGFLFPIAGIFIGSKIDKSNQKSLANEVEQKEEEARRAKAETEKKMKAKLRSFIASH